MTLHQQLLQAIDRYIQNKRVGKKSNYTDIGVKRAEHARDKLNQLYNEHGSTENINYYEAVLLYLDSEDFHQRKHIHIGPIKLGLIQRGSTELRHALLNILMTYLNEKSDFRLFKFLTKNRAQIPGQFNPTGAVHLLESEEETLARLYKKGEIKNRFMIPYLAPADSPSPQAYPKDHHAIRMKRF